MARTVNALGQTRTSFTCQTQVGTNGLQQSKTTITDGATGTQQTLVFRREDTGRAIRFAGVAQADGSTAQTTERNPQGQPTRQVNADGSVTFYTYNARGLEIERAQFDATFATATTTTRPALTKATSVTSTRWHATWNLPKEVAQPQLTTSYTYNARGDVTGYSTQATTDPTGAQKFEAIGTGPLDAMGYAYNANAQLSRIVQLQNGMAPTETTQRIPQYDPHGRPEVIVTPDGSRTRLIYNQRGALIRLVQGEQITHFTYDARGVMTRIKTPDGSVFALIYDSDVNLTQIRHNGKAITATYVATLSGEVKATVAEMAVAFAFALTDEVLDALWVVSTTALSTDRQQAQRERPLARQGGKTGQWWEYTDRNFQRWFHQCIKQPGDPDASRADLADAYAEWIQYGKPDGKNGCGGPPPPPPAPAENCGDACQKTANVVVVGGSAYVIYRCLRMLPSLLPPLWPTIPANAVTP